MDNIREMEAYLSLREGFDNTAAVLGADFFYFSILNVLPKLALGTLHLTGNYGGPVLSSADGSVLRPVPVGDPGSYYHTVLSCLSAGKATLFIPAPIQAHLKTSYKLAKQGDDYLYTTETLIAMPGGRLKQERRKLNNARDTCEEVPHTQDALLEINRRWYREAATRKFRTYDKTSIDWTIRNWGYLVTEAPDVDAAMVVCRDSGVPQAFTLGCRLRPGMWTAYTTRKLPDTEYKGCNLYSRALLAERREEPLCNGGTADTAQIRQVKERMRHAVLTAYKG